MRIIDSHTHLGSHTIVANVDELIASMDQAQINEALVYAGRINGITTYTLLEKIQPHKRLYGVASVSPLQPRESASNNKHFADFIAVLYNLLRDKAVVAIKFYTGYEAYYPYDERLMPYLDLLLKHNAPAIFHSGDLFNGVKGALLKYALPIHIDELAVKLPELKIVIAHLGNPFIIDTAQVCYKNKNVYTDTSGFVYGDFKERDIDNYRHSLKEFIRVCDGSSKLIFGTDYPVSNQKSYIQATLDAFNDLKLSKNEIEDIMGNRAVELFYLPINTSKNKDERNED